ncbi:MAG: tRNA pseudouridine(55) synthase TruB [Pseudomonadota bacterium]|uniref:tRNA pseudouridine synthase B n=1 Tax=Candidatus Desulfatibia profunda TaxID=2841695 RepID=A0A8J6TM37_9BACT|nr:tRNA pseudouridine(55) synthase TruB [Candidatus Desulfatibia profunda]MBL7179605.1 tRNA pseudouridine(55) synthase TruB [Desulfobacterales bacterium]MBU0697846.1 tRNA pseudouridine(55) synthase TruB [Pseudomonadota bacterium]
MNKSGILVVDKPANTTSAEVVAVVKRLLGARKTGHTGTLDPFATGVLVCCVNQATKLARFFLHSSKTYEAVLQLGVATDTQDLTGTVTATCDEVRFSDRAIRSVFSQFEGTLEQFPPVYSALKYKGVPLYKLARNGKPVQKQARRICISTIEILKIDLPLVRFVVSCSAGTYIRTLCADIGASLGCGGHLKELRRIKSAGFTIAEAVTLQQIEELALSARLFERMISMSNALPQMPEHVADKALNAKIMHGRILTKKDFIPGQMDALKGFIKIVDIDKNLIAVLQWTPETNRYRYCCVFNS